MKWALFVVLLVVVGGIVGAALLPMSVAADFARRHVAGLAYSDATGSVWNGKLQGVVIQGVSVGDVSVKLDAGQVFAGKASARIAFSRPELAGAAVVSRGLFGGRTDLAKVRLDGQVKAVPVLPSRVRATDGRFTLAIDKAVFGKNGCQSASGEVWSDALSKTDLGHGWIGPDLRGPVRCDAGRLEAATTGKTSTGEEVTANLGIGADLSLDLQARVANVSQGAIETLTSLGFQPESGAYALHRRLGESRPAAGSSEGG